MKGGKFQPFKKGGGKKPAKADPKEGTKRDKFEDLRKKGKGK